MKAVVTGLVVALVAGTAAAAVASSSTRDPTKSERRYFVAKFHRQFPPDPLVWINGICVSRAKPLYAAVLYEYGDAGGEASVYRKVKGGWKMVASGSGLDPKAPARVREVFEAVSGSCGRNMRKYKVTSRPLNGF